MGLYGGTEPGRENGISTLFIHENVDIVDNYCLRGFLLIFTNVSGPHSYYQQVTGGTIKINFWISLKGRKIMTFRSESRLFLQRSGTDPLEYPFPGRISICQYHLCRQGKGPGQIREGRLWFCRLLVGKHTEGLVGDNFWRLFKVAVISVGWCAYHLTMVAPTAFVFEKRRSRAGKIFQARAAVSYLISDNPPEPARPVRWGYYTPGRPDLTEYLIPRRCRVKEAWANSSWLIPS